MLSPATHRALSPSEGGFTLDYPALVLHSHPDKTHVEFLQYGDSLTGAAPTARPVVHRGVEAIEVGRQSEV